MGDEPRKPPTMIVMDLGQPDTAIAAQLGLRSRPPPQPQPGGCCVHSVEYHAGLVGLDFNGCRKRRQVNAAGTVKHHYVAAVEEQMKGKKRKQRSRPTGDGETRVGLEYQADVVPASVWNRTSVAEAQNTATCGYDQVWDPAQYRAASTKDNNIATFLGGVYREYNLTTNLMDHLHRKGYDVEAARDEYVRSNWDNSVNLKSGPQQKLFQRHVKTMIAGSKEMKKAADLIGCSRESMIVNYYRWKGEKRDSRSYKRIKQARHEESDECHVCGVGGKLIVCDLCRQSYHFECHKPPVVGDMSKVDVWYCYRCERASPARLRRRMRGSSFSTELSIKNSPGSCAFKKRSAPQSPSLALWKTITPKSMESSTAVAFRSDTTPSLATRNGLVYVAHIPVTERGLCIRIGRHEQHSSVFFKDYTRVGHEVGPAERANVFLSSGDILVAVDRIPCALLQYDKVRDLLKSKPTGNNNMKLLTMLHKPASNDACSPQMQAPETPPRFSVLKPASHTPLHPSSQFAHSSAPNRKVAVRTPPHPTSCGTHSSAPGQKVAYQSPSHTGAASMFQTTTHQSGGDAVSQQEQLQNGGSLQQLDIRLTVGVSRQQDEGNATMAAPPDPGYRRWIPNQLQQPQQGVGTSTVSTPSSPAITPTSPEDEAINSAALSHIWSLFAPTDMAGFFLRRGFSTVNHVITAHPTQLSTLLAVDQCMVLHHARDYIGTTRCELRTWLLHKNDSST